MTKNRAAKKDAWGRAAKTGDAYNVARRAMESDELIQQLADEAEAGYDPDKLVPRKS